MAIQSSLSILFVRFEEILNFVESVLEESFQFSLWDSSGFKAGWMHRYKEWWLSILFVRFLNNRNRALVEGVSSFNSLCEIHLLTQLMFLFYIITFNSLCEIHFIKRHPKRVLLFAFNSLCEIHWHENKMHLHFSILSILFVRFIYPIQANGITVELSFNSLCEILVEGFDGEYVSQGTFNSLCEIQIPECCENTFRFSCLSILFVRFS